jgi:hypothetical protein
MATTSPTTDDFRSDRRMRLLDRRMNPQGTEARVVATPGVTAAFEGARVSWGGIWGGVLSAVGVMLLLASLGVALGVGAADLQGVRPDTLGSAAGLYAAASLLIALFVGGLVSTRIGAIHDRATGFWEGALVWVVSVLLLAWLAASGVSGLMGGAFSMLGHAAQGMAAMMQPDSDAAARAVDAAWYTFGGFMVSLLVSILGAMAGRRRRPVIAPR